MGVAQMEEALEKHAFREGGSLEMQVQGWAPPRDGGELVHSVNRQFLLAYRAEKKLLPTTVVNQVTRAKAAELEEQQGFKPGRKQMRELKEQVTDELLPRAFGIRRDTRVWIDPVNRWLVIDAASPAKADEVRSLLLKTLDITLESVELNEAPVAVMTSWLAGNDAPPGFTDVILKTFDMADSYILLTTLDMPALKNLKVTLDTLDNLGFPRTKWNVVLNRGGSRVGLTAADVERTVGVPISVEVPSSVEVPARLNEGVTVVEANPRHAVAKAFFELAAKQRKSTGSSKVAAPAKPAKKSLFKRS